MKYNAIIDISKTEAEPTEPITPAEAKFHMRITFTDSDAYITALIKQCRMRLENYLGLSLVEKTIVAHLRVEVGTMELPYGPVIGDVVYTDKDATELTDVEETGINFKHIAACNPYIICTYNAGYNEDNPVPEDIKLALLEEVAYRYHHKGEELTPGICHAAKINAGSHRRISWL